MEGGEPLSGAATNEPTRHSHLSRPAMDFGLPRTQPAPPESISSQPILHSAQSFDRLPTVSQTGMNLPSPSAAVTGGPSVSTMQLSSVQPPFAMAAAVLPPPNPAPATTLPISSSIPPRLNPAQDRQPDKLLNTTPQTHPQSSHSLSSFPGAHTHTIMNSMGLSPANLQTHPSGLRSQTLPFHMQGAHFGRQDGTINQGMSMAIHNILNMNPITQSGIASATTVATGTAMPPLQMPLTHSLPTSIHAPLGHARGLPLLPAIPAMYPYAPYGGMGSMQGLPTQPGGGSAAGGMVRVNAPSPFPPQALVSGYPAYVPPSIYGNAPVSTGNFNR